MIRLASPDIRETDINKVKDVLLSGSLVQGRYVEAFEKSLIEYTKIPNCSVVSSGTAALHLSLLAIGIIPGDWVIVPAFTFPATANVVEILGANILLCDVDPQQYVVTPHEVEKIILKNSDKKIRAIIVVHEFGYPAQIKAISEIAKKYELFLIEDSACALGTIADGFHTGYFSDIACFSFHPRKAITTGEGGAVISRNEKLIKKIKSTRNHGIEYSDQKVKFIYSGFNYRMTEIQAVLGLGQLERFEKELSDRKFLSAIYYEQLNSFQHFQLPINNENHSWQSFMITLNENIDRGIIIEQMLKNGIQSNLGAQALSSLDYYKNKYEFLISDYPVSTMLYNSGLVLPLYGKLKSTDIVFIAETLKSIINNYYA
jgi:perosamine synthetase